MSAWPWFLASYLLGSLPTSWIVVKLVKGVGEYQCWALTSVQITTIVMNY